MFLRFFRKGGGNEEEEYDEEFLRDHSLSKIVDDDINEYSYYEIYSNDPSYDPNEFFLIGVTKEMKIVKITIGGDKYTPIIFKNADDIRPFQHIRVRNILEDGYRNEDLFYYKVFFPEDAKFEVIEYDKKNESLISQFLRGDNVGFEWNDGFLSKVVEILQQESEKMELVEVTNKILNTHFPNISQQQAEAFAWHIFWGSALLIGLGIVGVELP